jgi:hypothetical protein
VRSWLALKHTASLVKLVAEGEPLLLNKNAKPTYGPVEGVHHKLHLDRLIDKDRQSQKEEA